MEHLATELGNCPKEAIVVDLEEEQDNELVVESEEVLAVELVEDLAVELKKEVVPE